MFHVSTSSISRILTAESTDLDNTMQTKGLFDEWMDHMVYFLGFSQIMSYSSLVQIVKQSKKVVNPELSETSICDEEEQSEANLELYGRWQLETLQLPHAVNGIVPKV